MIGLTCHWHGLLLTTRAILRRAALTLKQWQFLWINLARFIHVLVARPSPLTVLPSTLFILAVQQNSHITDKFFFSPWHSTARRSSFDKNTFSIKCRVYVFLHTTPHRWCQSCYKENNPNYRYCRYKQNKHFAHEFRMHYGVFLASSSWSGLSLQKAHYRSNHPMQKWWTEEIKAALRDIIRWCIVSPFLEENRRTGLFVSPSGIKITFLTWQLRQSGNVGLW